MKPGSSERHLARRWALSSVSLGAAVLLVGMALTWPVAYFGAAPSPRAWLGATGLYFVMLADAIDDPKPVIDLFSAWWRQAMAAQGYPPTPWMLVWAAAGIVTVWRLAKNRYSFADDTHGNARVMRFDELRREGLFGRTGMVLGRIPAADGLADRLPVFRGMKGNWRLVRNWEPLSAMVIAPPGTGKTVQLIANLLADWPDNAELPGPSIIVNDPKGEICRATQGWRSTLGPTYRIAWGDAANSAHWNPLSPWAYPGGEEYTAARKEAIDILMPVFARPGVALQRLLLRYRDGGSGWAETCADNPAGEVGEIAQGQGVGDASAAIADVAPVVLRLSSLSSAREKHIDRMCAILIPDSIEQHWRITGREFLAGAIGFIMARCERLGIEPTFGLLLDELNETTKNGAFSDPVLAPAGVPGEGEAVKEMTIPGLGTKNSPTGGEIEETYDDDEDDLLGAKLKNWVAECDEWGYPARVKLDLGATLQKPDRERGSVVSTAGGSINIFKNAEVRAVTSRCDFRLADVRGVDGRPRTDYLVVSLEDAEIYGRMSGLYLESHAAFAISQDEQDIDRPLLMLVDEFWTLPPLQSLMQIPALGRGQRVQLMLVGQSLGQIGIKFRNSGGQQVVDTLVGAMSYVVTFTQNELATAKKISESIGNRTIEQVSVSRSGLSLDSLFSASGRGIGDRNLQTSKQSQPLFRPDQIMSMEKFDPRRGRWGWHLVQMTGRMNRPIVCRPVAWFKHPAMKGRGGLPVREWPVVNQQQTET